LKIITDPLERSLAELKDPTRAAKLQKGIEDVRRLLGEAV